VLWAGGLVFAATGGCYDGRGDHAADLSTGDGDGDDESADGGGGDDPAAACADVSVGVSPLRRLTRSQYDNTVRDLLGVTGSPSAALTPDEKAGAFFSNGTAPVSELVVEQYMRVAEEIAETAMADVDTLVPCPAGTDEAACGQQFVDDFGMRAFRRPLTEDERVVLVGLFEQGREAAGLAGGLQMVVQTALQSPQFLYHVELGMPQPGGTQDIVALGEYELASKLSYFLWDSMPDDALLDAAAAGELAEPDALRAQAERMLADDRASDAIASFHGQWLHLDELAGLEKNPEVYPEIDTAMREAMANETTRFADWVIRHDDARLQTLLTASYSFVEGPLADLYGLAPGDVDPTMPVELDPTQRAGLLTHAGVLAMHAHADQSSPIRRGKLVRETILCTPLSPPPPEVDVVPPPVDPNATTRERFDQHRTDPACAGCHMLIDPLGFGFEHYDGIGRWRDTEAGKPVDASGEILSTDDIDGEFDGAVELAERLASSEQVRTCLAEQWFAFGFGRAPGDDDACSFDTMYEAFEGSDHDIRALLLSMVTTDSFRYRRLAEGSQ
jgi:hypothetical protein